MTFHHERFSASAVLLDLDGTLVDSSPVLERSWTRWAIEFGVTKEAFVAAAPHGRTSDELVRELVAPDQVAEAQRRIIELEVADTEGLTAMPGAIELVGSLPEDRWAIVTSGIRAVAVPRLEAIGLKPKTLVTADDVRNGKPDPEPFLTAAGLLGIAPESCVVIEDAPAGVKAAKAAGMRAIAVTTTSTAADLSDSDLIVGSLQMLRVSLDGSRLTIAGPTPP